MMKEQITGRPKIIKMDCAVIVKDVAAALAITPVDGGTRSVSAHLLIEQIQ